MKYRAIVTDNQDPDNLGRIRAEVYGYNEKRNITPWVWPCTPFAGNDHGMYFVPELDSIVWVELTADGTWVYTGSHHGANHQRPNQAAVTQKIIKTKAGHELMFDDDGDVVIKQATGNSITLDKDGNISIKVSAENSINIGGDAVEPALLGNSFQEKFNELVNKFNSHSHSYIMPSSGGSPGTTGSTGDSASESDSNELTKKVLIK